MEYDGALGLIVGRPHGGLAAMFTMMNNARLGVGLQGVGVAEAALQAAVAFARDRRQGPTPVSSEPGILGHADVRRMLATMTALTSTARAVALDCALAIDMGRATGAAEWTARAAFLTPIAKAFGTDAGCAVAEMAVQVHGGMGYIEETGVAQFYRDVRVTPIYEGTNGVQAMDLVGRKLADGGDAARRMLAEVAATADAAGGDLGVRLATVCGALGDATDWMLAAEINDRFAGAAPYLRAFALVLGGRYLLRGAMAEGDGGQRAALAAFHMHRLATEVPGLCAGATAGAAGLYALDLAS